MQRTPLPSAFCWTRFGPEAGEGIHAILERKEQERLATGGTFFWGVGNSVAPGIAALLLDCDLPEVLFSPIRSRPRAIDCEPDSVVAWHTGTGLDGSTIRLPEGCRVSSRGGADVQSHYALVCHSSTPLCLDHHGDLEFESLYNLRSGNRLGASQVTAVVGRENGVSTGRSVYPVSLRVRLAPPYFIKFSAHSGPVNREPVLLAT